MRKIALVLFGLFLLVGCIPITPTVIEFTFQKTNYNLVEGSTERLYPVVKNLSEVPNITYTSSNTAVAEIIQESNYFTIKANSPGNAVITATLNNVQGKICTLVAKVTAAPTLEISIVGDEVLEFEIGGTYDFTITKNIDLTDTLVWSSSDEEVGVISDTGAFIAVGLGSTIITATVGSVTDEVMVNVVEEGAVVIEPTSIDVFGEDSVVIGEEISLWAEVDVDIPVTINWSSSNNAIATINSNGDVKGISKGTVVILASIAGYPSIAKTKTIEVLSEAPIIIDATELILSGPSAVNIDATITLSSAIGPEGATGTVLYSSSDDAIATVSPSGVVSGIAEGSVTITAVLQENEEITGTYEVTVNFVAPELISLTINGPDSVRVGSTISLEIVANPVGASSEVMWMSLSESKATVDGETGEVTGKTEGSVTITAISKVNSQKIASKTITVTPGPAISAEVSSESLYVGETVTVTGTVINSENTDVTYSSSNLLVATVDELTGVVTGVAPGSAIIIVTADVNPSLVATVDVLVAYAPTIAVSPTEATISIGQTLDLEVTIENLDNIDVEFLSSDEAVATVDVNGVVTAIAVGDATITITSLGDATLVVSTTITVVLSPTITILPATATVVAGQTVSITATVHNSSNADVVYSSSNELVATVNASTGVVTGVAAGSVTITATADVDAELKATATVTVTPAPTISMTPTTATVNQNETVTVVATVQNLSNTDVTYVSSNTAIATVNASTGVVTGVAAGSTTITATSVANSSLKATATITVNPAPAITVTPTTGSLAIGGTTTLTATVTYATNKGVTWVSSAPAVATVNATTGLVTAVSAGTATITATAAVNSSLKATATVTVTPANYTINYNLNSGAWTWTTGTVPTTGGIDSVSTLPEVFMVDFYGYLKDNNLLSSSIVDASLRKTTWASFSTLLSDPKASYNMVSPTIVTGNVNGYSQFFWNSVNSSTQTATGGFFGSEPFKTKYSNLLSHLLSLYALKTGSTAPNNYNDITSTDPVEIKKCKSGAGFILDGYFYGTQGLTGSTNDVAWKALRTKIPTPVLKYNATGSSSSATTYQITSYTYGSVAQLRAPVRVGYVFEGWYNNAGFTGTAVTSIAAKVAPAAMYYAKWTAAASYGGGTLPVEGLTIKIQAADSTFTSPSFTTLSKASSLITGTSTPYYQVWVYDSNNVPVTRKESAGTVKTSSNTGALTISAEWASITVIGTSGSIKITVTNAGRTGSVTVTLAP